MYLSTKHDFRQRREHPLGSDWQSLERWLHRDCLVLQVRAGNRSSVTWTFSCNGSYVTIAVDLYSYSGVFAGKIEGQNKSCGNCSTLNPGTFGPSSSCLKAISQPTCFGLESGMAMGTCKQRERQEPLWFQSELPEAPGLLALRRAATASLVLRAQRSFAGDSENSPRAVPAAIEASANRSHSPLSWPTSGAPMCPS